MAKPKIKRKAVIREYTNGEYSMQGYGEQPTIAEVLNMMVAFATIGIERVADCWAELGYESEEELRIGLSNAIGFAIQASVMGGEMVKIETESEKGATNE